MDPQSELYNARAFIKLLEKDFFLKQLKKDNTKKEGLIHIKINSLELTTKTLSLAHEANLYLEIGKRLHSIFQKDWFNWKN
jgi:hypothetical protein